MCWRSRIVCFVAMVGWAPAGWASSSLGTLLHDLPADSLVVPLRKLEKDPLHPAQAALAAMTLGQLHYARGEYRRSGEAFSRAAARLDPSRKGEARLWAARSWLALGDAEEARAEFSELAGEAEPIRSEALLGVALAWEAERHPDRALTTIEPSIAGVQGEIAPVMLERAFTLATAMNRDDLVEIARRRLSREFPNSPEATRVGLLPPSSVTAYVELGPFTSEPRAHTVADAARRAGFPRVQPRASGSGARRIFLVRLEGFSDADAARHAADRAKKELGVPARVVTEP